MNDVKEKIRNFDDLLTRLDEIEELDEETLLARARDLAPELLRLGEITLHFWIIARGGVPTKAKKEGFSILALHRQGAKGEPSFNACRESCRETVYQYNVIMQGDDDGQILRSLRLLVMVVRHLALFISGKLQVAGLGDFCCASKPIRQKDKDMSEMVRQA